MVTEDDDTLHRTHVEVENGRLNATLREALSELGVMTSHVESPEDVMVVLVRGDDGRIMLDGAATPVGGPIDDLLPLCWSVAGGANLSGRITVRVRRGDHGPVFVSVEAT